MPEPRPASKLIDGVLNREPGAIARAISLVEEGGAGARDLMRALRPRAGSAHRVGVTGPPGAGKSTLVCALAGRLANDEQRVGVLAVDPTSRFTQGSVLGDRVRMADLDRSEDIYIRSMATRGQGGGLALHTGAAADVLDAAGYGWLFVESVGVGQVELDIRNLVDTTLVVLVPESGDQVQAIKAGLMEIADIYIVNKCDRPGAGAMVSAVQSCVAQQHHPDLGWQPPVIGAAAMSGEGAVEILAELERHRRHLGTDGRLLARRRMGLEARLRQRLEQALAARILAGVPAEDLDSAVERILAGNACLEDVAQELLADWIGNLPHRT